MRLRAQAQVLRDLQRVEVAYREAMLSTVNHHGTRKVMAPGLREGLDRLSRNILMLQKSVTAEEFRRWPTVYDMTGDERPQERILQSWEIPEAERISERRHEKKQKRARKKKENESAGQFVENIKKRAQKNEK